ncbi:unnamed protein product [Ostreobium quekettii]|uniref:Uncharacterized protein n=1 Tax=Ostreobium quekettii TaxID=121088 RepID=A0A8S1IMP1_9CHLO|nr:unnamed protein product [Ostreobium quekettii]
MKDRKTARQPRDGNAQARRRHGPMGGRKPFGRLLHSTAPARGMGFKGRLGAALGGQAPGQVAVEADDAQPGHEPVDARENKAGGEGLASMRPRSIEGPLPAFLATWP